MVVVVVHYCCYLFLLFIIYSLLGYLCEIIYCTIESKKLVINRGFFIGPYLPIYGFSTILMCLSLEKYKHDVVALFVMSLVLCTTVEFITSYILEKIFNVRWWDYSHLSFNVNGRVCLLNSILFGIAGVIVIDFLNPFLVFLLDLLPTTILYTLSIILLIIFLLDVGISIAVLAKIKLSSMNYGKRDASADIIKLRNKALEKYTFFTTRLLNAFPKVEGLNKEQFIEIKKKVNKLRARLKEKKEKMREKKKKADS